MTAHVDDYGIEALTARAEILDRIHLYAHCVDRRRWELLSQVFHDDGQWWVSTLAELKPWQAAADESRVIFAAALGPTHHQVGNTLISIEGELAHVETYVTAYHRVLATAPAGGMFGGVGHDYDLISGTRYLDRFEHRDGTWRIALRRIHSEWRHMQSAADGILASVPAVTRGTYDDSDMSTPVIRRFRS